MRTDAAWEGGPRCSQAGGRARLQSPTASSASEHGAQSIWTPAPTHLAVARGPGKGGHAGPEPWRAASRVESARPPRAPPSAGDVAARPAETPPGAGARGGNAALPEAPRLGGGEALGGRHLLGGGLPRAGKTLQPSEKFAKLTILKLGRWGRSRPHANLHLAPCPLWSLQGQVWVRLGWRKLAGGPAHWKGWKGGSVAGRDKARRWERTWDRRGGSCEPEGGMGGLMLRVGWGGLDSTSSPPSVLTARGMRSVLLGSVATESTGAGG